MDDQLVPGDAPHLLAGLVNHVAVAVGHDHPRRQRGGRRSLRNSGLHLVLGIQVAGADDTVAHAFLGRVGHDAVHEQQPPHLYNAQDEHEEDNAYYCEFYEALAAGGASRAPAQADHVYVSGHKQINLTGKRRGGGAPASLPYVSNSLQ